MAIDPEDLERALAAALEPEPARVDAVVARVLRAMPSPVTRRGMRPLLALAAAAVIAVGAWAIWRQRGVAPRALAPAALTAAPTATIAAAPPRLVVIVGPSRTRDSGPYVITYGGSP